MRSSKDRTFRVGDRVRLREYLPPGHHRYPAGQFTGRHIDGFITYVLDGGRKGHDVERMGFEISHETCIFAYRVIAKVDANGQVVS